MENFANPSILTSIEILLTQLSFLFVVIQICCLMSAVVTIVIGQQLQSQFSKEFVDFLLKATVLELYLSFVFLICFLTTSIMLTIGKIA